MTSPRRTEIARPLCSGACVGFPASRPASEGQGCCGCGMGDSNCDVIPLHRDECWDRRLCVRGVLRGALGHLAARVWRVYQAIGWWKQGNWSGWGRRVCGLWVGCARRSAQETSNTLDSPSPGIGHASWHRVFYPFALDADLTPHIQWRDRGRLSWAAYTVFWASGGTSPS